LARLIPLRWKQRNINNDKLKRIVLLTNTHLSRNPRLVKEIEAFCRIYELDVIYFRYYKHFQLFDEQIERKYPSVKFHPFQWTSRYKSGRLKGIIISKICRAVSRWFQIQICPEQQIFPGYYSLLKKATSLEAHLYYGHNPGTLAVAVNAGKKNKALSGFDAEDFHRGEHHEVSKEKALIVQLEDKYLPRLDFFITSSPLIEKAYRKIYPTIRSEYVLNVFPKKKSSPNINRPSNSLRLIWFSQLVGRDRGIQDIILGINKFETVNIHFSIVGEVSDTDKSYFKKLKNSRDSFSIDFRGFLSPDVLDDLIPNYDIGIASEVGHTENNRYALSNKIFTYLRSGIAVLCSDTPAQKTFIDTYPSAGFLYSINNPESVYERLKFWAENPLVLEQHKQAAFHLSETYFNWEREQQKIISRLEGLLLSYS
jgi:glycosyltransferase involved in cell wall biosynthesis